MRSRWNRRRTKQAGISRLTAIVLAALLTPTMAADYYVSPQGDDQNPGTKDKPFATLGQAQDTIRSGREADREPVTVHLREGTYYLNQALVFTPSDSGTKDAPLAFAAFANERPTISGAVLLDGLTWKRHENGILKTSVPSERVKGLERFDQLFVNGKLQPLARYPNYDPQAQYFNGVADDAISPERASRWEDSAGGYLFAMHRSMWGDMSFRITGKNDKNEVQIEGGWQNNRPTAPHAKRRFVENIFEELDAPGEWFYDTQAETLYFLPPSDLDLSQARIEAAGLRHLVEFRGSEAAPVTDVSFRGVRFTHSLRTFLDTREPLLRSDWCIYRGGAILFEGAQRCELTDCDLDHLGGNAVFFSGYNRDCSISGCLIREIGASGVCFVGEPAAVRSPRFQYGSRFRFDELDKTPGPKTDQFPADCRVSDCLITRTGRVEKQTAPVQISMSARISVANCSIYDVPRAGINISEGTWGGHLIEFCDVFDTVKESGDHGSFNSWGRDRFWGLEDFDNDQLGAGEFAELPKWDACETTVIRNSRWQCDHGWDIDLDDGSTNYHISNNLCLKGGIKNREGFYRVVENNIMVNNGFHPHVWYTNSQDIFRRNIVFRPYRPARMSNTRPWGQEMGHNLLHSTTGSGVAVELQRASKRDEHSLQGDAMFVDPSTLDYRVKDDSPARELGFENFPMDRFGVTSKRLRAMARTPDVPPADEGSTGPTRRTKRDNRIHAWLGAKVKNLVGLGEQSATGMSDQTGVLVTEVPADSRAAEIGIQAGDVILGLAGDRIDDVNDLFRRYGAVPRTKKVSLHLFRNQVKTTLTIDGPRDIRLSPGRATILGEGAKPRFDRRKDFLGSWNNHKTWLQWQVDLTEGGDYAVEIVMACPRGSAGSTYVVEVGAQELKVMVVATGGWEMFQTCRLGVVSIASPGATTVSLRPIQKSGDAVMNVRAVVLRPLCPD